MSDTIEATAESTAGRGKITQPGIYNLSHEAYHADPCDSPSLGSTGARILASDCPAAFRYKTDNPEVKEEFDIGNATHLLVLEPDIFASKIAVIRGTDKKGNPSEGYQTTDAKEKRDVARAAGLIPLLPKQMEQVEGMRASLASDPIARFAFQNTEIERSMFWRDPEFGFWCKTRPDALPKSRRYLIDLKTSASSDPEDFRKAVVNFGYHQQSAWYLDGVEAVTGDRPERFAFVVVGKSPPYLVTTCWLDADAIEWGRILNRYARGLFAWCLERNEWPSYKPDPVAPPAAFTISLPEWARRDLERRHEEGQFTPPQERIAA
jgi:PDDEXK-like domain of unknown function (DUF3799)